MQGYIDSKNNYYEGDKQGNDLVVPKRPQPEYMWNGTQWEIPTDYYLANNIERLWQAAYNYNFQSISGPAVGLVTIGIMSNKPKCMAVQAWVNSIWDLYYTRKANVVGNRIIADSELDFSSCGPIPYTIPELRQELGN